MAVRLLSVRCKSVAQATDLFLAEWPPRTALLLRQGPLASSWRICWMAMLVLGPCAAAAFAAGALAETDAPWLPAERAIQASR